MEFTFEAGGWWPYLVVFFAAAIPIIEILVVIPAGVIAGLSPLPTAVVALAGNLSTVVLIGLIGEKIIGRWRQRRRGGDRRASPRSQRARRLAQKWGVPGLALLAPITTGTHLATVAALATGATKRTVLRWMTAGLTVWAAAAGVTMAAGLEVFG